MEVDHSNCPNKFTGTVLNKCPDCGQPLYLPGKDRGTGGFARGTNMPETIQIPRAWLKNLIYFLETVEYILGGFKYLEKSTERRLLAGHIESAKSLLK